MLHTLVTIRVHCDTVGCPAHAERTVAHVQAPRTLLAGARRSIRRRDGWQLRGRWWFGAGADLCPTCLASATLDGPLFAFDPAVTPPAEADPGAFDALLDTLAAAARSAPPSAAPDPPTVDEVLAPAAAG